MLPGSDSDRTTGYAGAVISGEVVAGPLIRKACARHLADLERGEFIFDREAAELAISMFGEMKIKGSLGLMKVGEPLPWQAFVIGSLIGWKRRGPLGWRRYRKAYIEAGRASGKTPMVAFVVLWLFLLARGIDPECWFAAGGGERQAKIAFMDAVRFVENDEALSRMLQIDGAGNPWRIRSVSGGRGSVQKVALDSTGRGVSGGRTYAVMLDEYHEAKTDDGMRQFESTATKTEGSLVAVVTNAGKVPAGPCWDERLMAVSGMDEDDPDDRLFAYIAGMDEGTTRGTRRHGRRRIRGSSTVCRISRRFGGSSRRGRERRRRWRTSGASTCASGRRAASRLSRCPTGRPCR